MGEHPDAVLVERAKGGDRMAYAELIRRHTRRVFAVSMSLAGNMHDAEDITQQALLQGMKRISKLKEPGRFGAWICRIARNLCIDHLRSKKPQPLAQAESSRSHDTDAYLDLRDALAMLPEQYRLPLMMYYFDGRSTRKLADSLGVSEAGALTRLSRARAKLRQILQREKGGT